MLSGAGAVEASAICSIPGKGHGLTRYWRFLVLTPDRHNEEPSKLMPLLGLPITTLAVLLLLYVLFEPYHLLYHLKQSIRIKKKLAQTLANVFKS